MKRVSVNIVEAWALKQGWMLVRRIQFSLAVASEKLTYVSPSGNIVNFLFNQDGECRDVYEGRRVES